MDGWMGGCEVFNVGQWAFVDGLGVNPKADPETIGLAVLILRQEARLSLCQGTPRGIIDRELSIFNDLFYICTNAIKRKDFYFCL